MQFLKIVDAGYVPVSNAYISININWIADFFQVSTTFMKVGELKITQSNTQHPCACYSPFKNDPLVIICFATMIENELKIFLYRFQRVRAYGVEFSLPS